MKKNNERSPSYIKSAFTLDYIGTTPNENRIFIIGILPAALGLTGGGMSSYIYLFPNDKSHCAMIPGFVLAIFFGWFAQISMRRAFQMKDRDRRILLLRKIRTIPLISVGLALLGLVISLTVWFLPPANAPRLFTGIAGFAAVFPVIGILLTPFSFAARRIGWLVNPR